MLIAELLKGGIHGIFTSLADLIGTVKADPLEVIKLQTSITRAEMEVNTALIQAQAQINALEAVHTSKFISWWRPAAGWACVSGLVYDVFVRPIFQNLVTLAYPDYIAAPLDSNVLMTLLFGMLGLGAYRTYEKVQK